MSSDAFVERATEAANEAKELSNERVTPALHSPLMAVTNAISSVIIVGALIAAGPAEFSFSEIMGFIAVTLASINIFGGFIVTQRMLAMFKKKK
jgi:NAD(P) transhydrogenase subunit alpha